MALLRNYSQIEELRRAGELTPAEEQLLAECRSGELVELGDSARPDHASPDRTIRADLLRYLILGGCEAFRTHEHGVLVEGAWVDGDLDLAFATARGATVLRDCVFQEAIDATQARLQRLDLGGSRLKGLLANNCHVAGDLWLDRIESSGPILLVGATIGGPLSCEAARLDGGGGKALNAQSAQVTGSVSLGAATTTGEVSFAGAAIGGQLSCKGARLDGGGGTALNVQGARVSADVSLKTVTTTGEVSFAGAAIGGQFSCKGARLHGGGGKALNAQGAQIAADALLRGVRSKGEVSFAGATIGGQLSCKGATLDCSGGKALNAQGARVSGGVFLRKLNSTGEVRLSGATIGGQLACDHVRFGGGGKALNAQRLRVEGGFLWRGVASVADGVDLTSAHVADLVDDRESWEKANALSLVGLTYDNLVGPLDEEMRLAWLRKGAKLNGAFHPQPYQQLARVLRASGHRAEARAVLIAMERERYRAIRSRLRQGIHHRRDVRRLSLDPTQDAWESAEQSARRAAALSRTLAPAFNLRHEDRPLEAGTSAYERELARLDFRNRLLAANTIARTAGALLQLRNALSHLFTGYGYAPWRIAWPLLILIFLQAVLAFATWRAGDFAPNSDVILVSEGWTEIANTPGGLSVNAAELWSSRTGAGRDYETFNALSYAVDVVLPLVELDQEAAWAPSPARGWLGWFAHHAQKVFVILGWIVAAIFAGAVTGIIRRDD